MPNEQPGLARRLWDALHFVEDSALVGLLLMMILLAVAQIFLRNFADASIVWADPFLRVSVLWIGLLGATIAARDNQHIAIDIATRYLPERLARLTAVLLALFTALVCGMVGWSAAQFVHDEYGYGSMAFGQVPAWACEIIMPIAFLLIALRYIIIATGVATGRRPVRKEGV